MVSGGDFVETIPTPPPSREETLLRGARMLNRCNAVLIRANDEPQLLDDICHVIVLSGCYRRARVFYASNKDEPAPEPAAQFGGASPTPDDAGEALTLLLSGNGEILGQLVIEGEAIDSDHYSLLEELADNLAATLLNLRQRSRNDAARAELTLAATAFASREGMFVTDIEGTILRVNESFTAITGYSADEVIGKNPRLLQSGQHDARFYRELWDIILRKGYWHGEIWNRRKDGSLFPERLTISAVKNKAGQIENYVATLSDITERKAVEDEIQRLAFYDPLTGLPNRRLLIDRLQRALSSSARSGSGGALLFIDLDHFKALNDNYGHDVGDLLLQAVTERLKACVRDGDTVARLGGDEFVIMLENLDPRGEEAAAQAESIGSKILATLNEPFQLGLHLHRTTASIGAALFREKHDSVDELLKRADIAMYQAKASGRNAVRFFDPEMQAMISARNQLDSELRDGIGAGQLYLDYQPQFDSAGTMFACEALVRWRHPRHGRLLPGDFIPLAEESVASLAVGDWVLQEACRQINRWSAPHKLSDLTIAVNISARQFRQRDFVAKIEHWLDETGADPRRLVLELTEAMIFGEITESLEKMRPLARRGVGFALDNFGGAAHSLALIQDIPLVALKIAPLFIEDRAEGPDRFPIASSIIALGDALGLKVIAEAVETQSQRDRLMAQGCRFFQGFLFASPMSPDAMRGWRQ